MKIFSRSAEKEKPAATAPSATPAPAAPSLAPSGPAAAAAGGPAPAFNTPAAPPAPDISAIIDANVKEMSEKIARLATNIEGDKSDRTEFEAKIEKMEERMRKLSALTEMISAQYNPFVGAAPMEREPMPQPEVGLAAPPAGLAPPAPAFAPAPPPPAPLPAEDPLAAVASALAPPLPEPAPVSVPVMGPAPAPMLEPELRTSEPAFEAFHAPADPTYGLAPPMLDATPRSSAADGEDGNADDDGAAAARLWSVRPSFGSSMLMLAWADMLLKNAPDRNALVQLLDYYHNIAWIGPPARDQLLAYADGIRHEAPAPSGAEWRASLEVHEKSLLFVEKLRAITDGRGKGD